MTGMTDDLLASLIAATQEVFEKMVSSRLVSKTPIVGEALRPSSNVVATAAFTGDRCGVVAFYSTTQTARDIAGTMLGIPPEDVNGEMPDAIGEITNMITGAFRMRLAARGHKCAISVPSVTIGSDFYVKYVSDVRRTLCPFAMDDRQEIFVELILTEDGQPPASADSR